MASKVIRGLLSEASVVGFYQTLGEIERQARDGADALEKGDVNGAMLCFNGILGMVQEMLEPTPRRERVGVGESEELHKALDGVIARWNQRQEFEVAYYDDNTIEGFIWHDNFYPAADVADPLRAAQFDVPVPLRLKWQEMIAKEGAHAPPSDAYPHVRTRSVPVPQAESLLAEILDVERDGDPTQTASTPDIEVQNHGSIILLAPVSDAADEWLREHVGEDAQWFGGALAVERRYAYDIISGAIEDGLVVK